MKQHHLLKYFQIFSKFLSRDLYVSLRPLTNKETIDKVKYNIGGRQEYILYLFVQVFKLIVDSKASNETIRNSLKDFSDIIDVYLNINEESSPSINEKFILNATKIDTNLIESMCDENALRFYQPLFEAMAHLKDHSTNYRAMIVELHKQNEIKAEKSDLQKIKTVLTQSIIEFSNALAHMLFVLIDNKDEYGNIKKAFTHIHRATLDNYKAMIRHLEVDEEIKMKLINLRINEFFSIGICTDTKDKIQIINEYKNLILSMLSNFPNNASVINELKSKKQ